MNAETAIKLLKDQLDGDFDAKHLLHVCLDVDSKRLYVINKDYFTKDQFNDLLGKIQEKITENFGGYSDDPIIYGSPFSSLRVRPLESFKYIQDIVEEELDGQGIESIPVIEVNLNRMPSVTKALPERYKQGMVLGGYISPSDVTGMHFYEEIDITGKRKKTAEKLLSQKAPFIFINIGSDPSSPEKEWHVLNGYREYFRDQHIFDDQAGTKPSDAFLFAIKRFLKLGWTFEEICDIFIKNTESLVDLIVSSNELMSIANSFEEEGYENPASTPYYVTFKIDDKFPIHLDSMIDDEAFSDKKQLPWLKIINYNKRTKFIVIETPIYIRESVWRKIFKPVNSPLVTRYNRYTRTIDVKSDSYSYDNLEKGDKDAKMQLAVIQHFTNELKMPFRCDNNSRSTRISDGVSFHLKDITDYHDACEQLKGLADKRSIKFEELNIVVGPLERIFGRGVRGGFMDEESFKKSDMEVPYEITKGIFVKPPLIAIDSIEMPSPAEQASTLVHEYCHNLFHIKNPEYENLYHKDPSLKEKDNDKYWYLYLTDEDERQAHGEQVKFEIKSGKSIDEMIRDKVGGKVTPDNYNIAILFKDIIDEAIKEMETENE
jgi:hypothetical protein